MRLVAGVWIAARPLAGHIQTSHARGVNANPHCGLFSKVQTTLRSSVGKNVDRVTRFSGIDVDCHQKSVVFRRGRTVATVMPLQDGQEVRVTASCHDAQA